MKIENTEISSKMNSFISVIRRDEPFFQSPFHCHPEYELVYIEESHGKRVIGNSIEDFEAGDMVFLGSNIPHVWLNDEVYYHCTTKGKARAIVAYFNKEIFGPSFYQMPETSRICALFDQSIKGMCIRGKTKEDIADKLNALLKKKDFDIVIGLFEILSVLACSKDIRFINPNAYAPVDGDKKNDRLTGVYKHVKENFRKEISLSDVSRIANLTTSAFCRLFKSRTGKHFVGYINEVRISNACKLLMETDMTVSEIAYSCGYQHVSNFDKVFKKITGLTPKQYKNSITG